MRAMGYWPKLSSGMDGQIDGSTPFENIIFLNKLQTNLDPKSASKNKDGSLLCGWF